MRVGVVVQETGAEFGGGFTFREEIYRALVDSEFKTCLEYVFLVEGTRPGYLEKSTCFPLVLPRVEPAPFVPLWKRVLFRLYPNLKKPQPEPIDYPTVNGNRVGNYADVLYFCYPDILTGVDVPVISTIWDLSHRYVPHFPELTAGKNREYRESHFQKLSLYSDLIIIGTGRGRYELGHYYRVDPERTWMIPHPTPEDAIKFAETGNSDVERGEDPFFIYPSQFWAHKNHVTLVKAWRLLKERGGKVPRLVFTGSNQGNQEHVAAMVEQWGLTGEIEFTGFLERECLLKRIQQSVAVLFPCLFGPENFPQLEAGALGCPTVLADVPGFREQMGDAALYVADPVDPLQWAMAVEEFSKNPDLRDDIGGKARTRALSFRSRDFVRKLDEELVKFSRYRDLWERHEG